MDYLMKEELYREILSDKSLIAKLSNISSMEMDENIKDALQEVLTARL